MYSFYWIQDHQDTFAASTPTHISDQTATLTYASTGSNFWEKTWTGTITCPDGVGRSVLVTCDLNNPTDPTFGGTLHLNGPGMYKAFLPGDPINYSPWPAASGGHQNFEAYGTPDNPVSGRFACTPIFKRDNDGYSGLADSTPVNGGYRVLSDSSTAAYVGNCCLTPITVGGCNGAVVPGATYSIWADSTKGSLIDSGTTDSGGVVALDAIFCSTTLYREISHPRFTTVSGTTTYNGVSKADSITTPVTGYRCLFGCGAPVANTIHATFSVAGAQTLVNSGSGWTVSFTASTHSYVVTLAADGTITITRDGVSCGSATFTINVCPPAFSGTITVPTGTCATELGASASVTE